MAYPDGHSLRSEHPKRKPAFASAPSASSAAVTETCPIGLVSPNPRRQWSLQSCGPRRSGFSGARGDAATLLVAVFRPSDQVGRPIVVRPARGKPSPSCFSASPPGDSPSRGLWQQPRRARWHTAICCKPDVLRKGPQFGAFLPAALMYFLFRLNRGSFYSGVDTPFLKSQKRGYCELENPVSRCIASASTGSHTKSGRVQLLDLLCDPAVMAQSFCPVEKSDQRTCIKDPCSASSSEAREIFAIF